MMGSIRFLIIVGCLVATAFSQDVGEIPAKPKIAPKITISKETTWATEPVGPDGFIDYAAVLNRRCSAGVTPDNNAVVPLYQAMGPAPEGTRQPDEFFKLLGIDPLPAEGDYFQSLQQWWQKKVKKARELDINAIFEMQRLAGARPWKRDEFPEIAEWLEDNQKPLQLVSEAVSRTEYFSPIVLSDPDEGLIAVLLPGVQRSREFARALAARGMLLLGEGRRFEAWREFISLHRLGRLVGRGPTLIEGLVGIAIESIAIEAELRFISEVQPPATQVAFFVKHIRNLPPRARTGEKIDSAERAFFLDACHRMARGQESLTDLAGANADSIPVQILQGIVAQSVDWDQILKSGNRWYDRLVAAFNLPTFREREAAFRKLEDELKELARNRPRAAALALLGGKPALTQFTSDILISLILPAVSSAGRAEDRIVQRMRNLEIALALSAWHSRHKGYPAALADLAPDYLPEIPVDLFNDGPLRYERTTDGYRLYSVGENQQDDSGRTFGDEPRGDDLIVHMPLPLPASDR